MHFSRKKQDCGELVSVTAAILSRSFPAFRPRCRQLEGEQKGVRRTQLQSEAEIYKKRKAGEHQGRQR